MGTDTFSSGPTGWKSLPDSQCDSAVEYDGDSAWHENAFLCRRNRVLYKSTFTNLLSLSISDRPFILIYWVRHRLGHSHEFPFGGGVQYRGQTSGQRSRAGVGFFYFCLEMVSVGAKATNAVHSHRFSGDYSEKTDLRLVNCLVIISGRWTRKTIP